jgi:L-lactate utilization protein LutC
MSVVSINKVSKKSPKTARSAFECTGYGTTTVDLTGIVIAEDEEQAEELWLEALHHADDESVHFYEEVEWQASNAKPFSESESAWVLYRKTIVDELQSEADSEDVSISFVLSSDEKLRFDKEGAQVR